jgi:hypothetical protein
MRFAQVAQPSFPNWQNFSHLPAPPTPKTNFPPRFTHAQPTPGNPVPMDIDALDIRNFNRDTVEVLLQKLNARMDEMNLATSESKIILEENSLLEEDFPPSSK